MNTRYFEQKRFARPLSVMLSALLTVPVFVGCGGGNQANLPPVDDSRTAAPANPRNSPQAKKGLTNTQKTVAVLAGAAALYYLYNQRKNSKAEGAQGKYYLSKNGRVYYRDAQKRVHWVTPPSEGIRVPAQEAERYREFQGYNNRPTGRNLTGLPEAQGAI